MEATLIFYGHDIVVPETGKGVDHMKNNIWLNGIMGVIVGDALGLPAQFKDRSVFKNRPVTDMEGYGTFCLPAGSWSDDGSLTIATVASINEKHAIDCEDIMGRFVEWLYEGKYTPFGEAFDEGMICMRAIDNFKECLVKAVNLGDDTDTTAAIAGGLAGVFYGYGSMPEEWLEKVQRREWIEKMCVTESGGNE